jgi:rSAM/selenodomain-associated transferase 2
VSRPPELSVVIPTWNEQSRIARALASTRAPGVERIVVDGGSTDATVEEARTLGAEQVLSSPAGRAVQMNAGLAAAAGEIVLFLHADTRLEAGWADAVRAALANPSVAGGAFRLRFDGGGFGMRVIEFGAELRCRLGRLPYGDQGIFARKRILDAAGGIEAVPIFEDLDLVQLIRRNGALRLLDRTAFTSARRYDRNGVTRQWLRNVVALAGYLLGVDRAALARWYRRRPRA